MFVTSPNIPILTVSHIYETMVNSGEIKLLRNYKIVNGIRESEEKYIYVNRMENNEIEVITGLIDKELVIK